MNARILGRGTMATAILVSLVSIASLARLPSPVTDASPSCGAIWEVVTTPSVTQPSVLNGVAGAASDDVWAVGSSDGVSLLMQWDGNSWTRYTAGALPFPSSLNAVAAVSSDDAWAVGSTGGQTLILRLQQGIWNVIPSQSPGTTFNMLSDVAVVSASDVWAVGYSISSPGVSQALIEHFDGSVWSVVPAPAGTALTSIASISSNDVWAVGYSGSVPNSTTLILHWDGSNWSVVDSPVPSAGFTSELRLSSIAAVSANDIWAVGSFISGGGPQTLLERFDGSVWTIVPSPNSQTTYDQLRSLAAVSSDDIWAVGTSLTKQTFENKTLVKHWNGQTWSVIPSPNPPVTNSSLIGMAAITPSDLWAVGAEFQSTSPSNLFALHFCGQLTTPSPTPPPVQTTLSEDAPAGASVLQPADDSGFAQRDLVVINPDGLNEEYSVVNALGSLDLAAPLEFTHSAGETVVRVQTGIEPGDADCSKTPINVTDVLSVLRRAASTGPGDHCVAAGNVRCHDAIDALDAFDLLLFIAGFPPDVGDCPVPGT